MAAAAEEAADAAREVLIVSDGDLSFSRAVLRALKFWRKAERYGLARTHRRALANLLPREVLQCMLGDAELAREARFTVTNYESEPALLAKYANYASNLHYLRASADVPCEVLHGVDFAESRCDWAARFDLAICNHPYAAGGAAASAALCAQLLQRFGAWLKPAGGALLSLLGAQFETWAVEPAAAAQRLRVTAAEPLFEQLPRVFATRGSTGGFIRNSGATRRGADLRSQTYFFRKAAV